MGRCPSAHLAAAFGSPPGDVEGAPDAPREAQHGSWEHNSGATRMHALERITRKTGRFPWPTARMERGPTVFSSCLAVAMSGGVQRELKRIVLVSPPSSPLAWIAAHQNGNAQRRSSTELLIRPSLFR